eukprot:tig00000955_g5778.t1
MDAFVGGVILRAPRFGVEPPVAVGRRRARVCAPRRLGSSAAARGQRHFIVCASGSSGDSRPADAEVELVRKLFSAGDEAGIITLFAKKDELLAKKDAEKNLITKEKNRIAEEKNLIAKEKNRIAKEKNRIAEERDIAKAKLDPVDRLIDTLHLALMRLKAKAPPALKPLFSFPVALGLLLIVWLILLFRMY